MVRELCGYPVVCAHCVMEAMFEMHTHPCALREGHILRDGLPHLHGSVPDCADHHDVLKALRRVSGDSSEG
jgi:hypothetical protein